MGTHQKHHAKALQMNTHNIYFCGETKKKNSFGFWLKKAAYLSGAMTSGGGNEKKYMLLALGKHAKSICRQQRSRPVCISAQSNKSFAVCFPNSAAFKHCMSWQQNHCLDSLVWIFAIYIGLGSKFLRWHKLALLCRNGPVWEHWWLFIQWRWMRMRLVIRRYGFDASRVGNVLLWRLIMKYDHEIFSTVILSLPLIQEGQLSVSGEKMCTILVNCLEDWACPGKVWLSKLTALDMIPLGWLGHKTSSQTIQ